MAEWPRGLGLCLGLLGLVSTASEAVNAPKPCSGSPVLSMIRDFAPECISSCPEVCQPLEGLIASVMMGQDPFLTICPNWQTFYCMALPEVLGSCTPLLDAAKLYVGIDLPRNGQQLMEVCAVSSSTASIADTTETKTRTETETETTTRAPTPTSPTTPSTPSTPSTPPTTTNLVAPRSVPGGASTTTQVSTASTSNSVDETTTTPGSKTTDSATTTTTTTTATSATSATTTAGTTTTTTSMTTSTTTPTTATTSTSVSTAASTTAPLPGSTVTTSVPADLFTHEGGNASTEKTETLAEEAKLQPMLNQSENDTENASASWTEAGADDFKDGYVLDGARSSLPLLSLALSMVQWSLRL